MLIFGKVFGRSDYTQFVGKHDQMATGTKILEDKKIVPISTYKNVNGHIIYI